MKYIFTLIIILSTNAYAAKEHPIDIALDKCLDIKLNQTTSGMNKCVNESAEEWDKELNRVYKLLKAELTSEGQKALVLSQREWIKQRDLEFKFLKSMYFRQKFSGSMYSNMHNMDALYVVKNRVTTLTKYLKRH